MKAMFQENKDIYNPIKEKDEKHQKFEENRKISFHSKGLMKNKIIIGEDDMDNEVKKNTSINIQIDHDALEEETNQAVILNRPNKDKEGENPDKK